MFTGPFSTAALYAATAVAAFGLWSAPARAEAGTGAGAGSSASVTAVPPVTGAGTASGARELTLDEAVAMARRSNKSMVAERARVAQAQVGLEQAWTVLFPTLAVQGKYGRNNKKVSLPFGTGGSAITFQPLNQLDGAANFSTLLFAPAVYTGLKAIESQVDAAEAGAASAEDSMLFTVAQTFYTAAISEEVLLARTSSIDVAKATLDNARARFGAGTVTKVDVDRAELAVLRAEQAKREALLAREQAYRSLSTLIGADTPFRVKPIERAALPASGGAADERQDLDMVLKMRPEFQTLVATARADELQRRSYAWRWAPSLSAFGNARVFNYKNFAQDSYSWVVGATLDWVIFDGGGRDSQRHLAAAQAAEALARAEVLRDSIRDDLANGRRQLETKGQAQVTAERSVELARETVDLVRIQYEAGASTQVDLLQAQDSLVAAREALAQAHFDVAVADLTLRRAAGTFPGR